VGSTNGPLGTCESNPAAGVGTRMTRTTGPGFDPNTDNVVPIVAPGCRTSSVRLGNQESGYGGECMEKTFLVTTNNVLFTYLYAVVLEDPGHVDANQPRFEITVKNSAGALVSCGGLYSITSTNASLDGFVNATAPPCGGSSIWYKNWTAVGTDLTPYLGQNVTIKFCTGDCTQGGHFGYAYVDTYCKPKEINGSTVCTTGGAVTLTAPAGFSNYKWHTGTSTGPIVGTGQTTVINPAVDGAVYTVEFESIVGSGCKSTVTDTIKVITANAVNDTTICNGATGTKKLTASSNDPTATYSWTSTPAGFTSTSATPSVTLPAVTTVYKVTVSSALGCTITKQVTITVTPPPTITVNSPTICPGASATLTGSGGTTYVWSTGATTTAITVSPAVTTSYTVTGTLGCTNSARAVVTISPPPAATASANTPCEGATLNLTSTGGTSWSWSGPGGYTSTSQNPNRPSSTTAMNGVYTVTVTSAGCTNTATVNVTVNPLPIVSVNSPSICPGTSATLIAAGGTTYLWSTGETTTSISVSPLITSSYTVTGTTTGCSASAVATVTIGGTLTVNVNSPTVCAGTAATLNASGATTYTWSTGETTTSITVTPATTTSYSITGTSAGCSGSGTATVTVNPLPVATAAANTPCAGTALNLTSTGGTSWSWSGPGGFTSTSQNPSIPSATVAMNGVYTVVVTALGCTASATVNVTVNPLPVITVNSPTICLGGSTTLTAGGGTTYVWSTTATTTSITITPGATTSYTVTGTTLGCTGSALATVTVNPPCGVNVNTTSATVCNGGCATVTATASSGTPPYTFLWAAGGQTTTSVTLCPATTTTSYTVTVTDNVGNTATAIASITVNPNPVVSSTNSSYCFGGSTTLTANGADTYTWLPTTGLTPSSGSPVTANPSSTTTYTITGTTTTTGCTGTSTVVVTVNPNPTVTVPGASICVGGSTPLNASGADTYIWTPAASLSSSTGSTVTASPNVSTTYTVTGSTLAGCTGTTTVVVAVGSLVADAGPDKAICSGDTTTLNATGGSGYSWSPGTGLSSTTVSNPTAFPTVTTTYTVTVTSGICVDTDVVVVVVDPPIVLNIAGFPPKCTGGIDGQAVVIPSGGDGTYTYQWAPVTGTNASVNGPAGTYTVVVTDLFGCTAVTSTVVIDPTPVAGTTSVLTAHCGLADGSATVSTNTGGTGTYTYSWNTNPIQTTQTAINIPQGTYIVTITDGNGCTTTVSAVVPDASGIAANIPASTNVSCYGGSDGSATATGVGGTPAYTYLWNNGQTSSSATNLSAGIYSVTVTDVYGCSATTGVTITQPTRVVVTSTDDIICPLNSATLTTSGTGGTGAIDFVWNPGNLTGSSVTVSPLTTTTYTITGTDANGCNGSTESVVTVNPTPTVSVPSDTICFGKSTTLTASGASSYSWSPTTGLSSGSGNPVTANPTVTTTYIVIGTDAAGCTNSTNVTVTVDPLPVVTIPPAGICPGDTTTLTASGAYIYSWSPGTGLDTTAGATVKAFPSGTIKYTVTGTNQQGCTSSSQVTVTVNPNPNASFTASPNPASIFDPVISFNDNTGTAVTWAWNFGDPKNSGSTSQNPTFTYPDTVGNYKVRLIVTNQYGCIDTTWGTVVIKGEYTFFIPNTFTPNGDGINDGFTPKGTGIDINDYELWIFDRWGNLIWQTETWGQEWDGRANNGDDVAQIDTYVWKVHVRELDTQIIHNYIGHVNIVK
ncbi:MAG: gliding motility-associated C-terminal domain-containing protein, partial [Bacteroidota bacterium]